MQLHGIALGPGIGLKAGMGRRAQCTRLLETSGRAAPLILVANAAQIRSIVLENEVVQCDGIVKVVGGDVGEVLWNAGEYLVRARSRILHDFVRVGLVERGCTGHARCPGSITAQPNDIEALVASGQAVQHRACRSISTDACRNWDADTLVRTWFMHSFLAHATW